MHTTLPPLVVRSTATSGSNDSNGTTPLTRKSGATSPSEIGRCAICACHHLSYGVNKIRAPSPTKTAAKPPMAMAISIISSSGDGGFDFAE